MPSDVILADVPPSGPAKPVSLRDVAKLANVSVATVSMVLNESPRISRATHARVQRVIEKTGYKPNRLAQSLSSKYTCVLAVIMPALRHSLADPYFGEAVSGICDRAYKLGHKVMIESAKPEFIKEKRHIELFDRRYVDGALLVGFNDRHGFLREFVERELPVVSVNNYFGTLDIGHVVCDYRSGAQQIMNYLQQLGHQKIGLICGAPDTQTQQDLIAIWRDRQHQAGGCADQTCMADGRFTEAGGAAAAEALLRAHPDITAIFAGNDKMAMGAMHYLAQQGLRIPADISVTGFDDIAHTAFVTPGLTTVHVPLYEAGAMACERLIERIRGRIERVREKLPTHLVVRDGYRPHLRRAGRPDDDRPGSKRPHGSANDGCRTDSWRGAGCRTGRSAGRPGGVSGQGGSGVDDVGRRERSDSCSGVARGPGRLGERPESNPRESSGKRRIRS